MRLLEIEAPLLLLGEGYIEVLLVAEQIFAAVVAAGASSPSLAFARPSEAFAFGRHHLDQPSSLRITGIIGTFDTRPYRLASYLEQLVAESAFATATRAYSLVRQLKA